MNNEEIKLHNYLNNYIKDQPAESFIRRHWNIHDSLPSKNHAIMQGSEDHIHQLKKVLFEKEETILRLCSRNHSLADELHYLKHFNLKQN